jgi:hypothetical protein
VVGSRPTTMARTARTVAALLASFALLATACDDDGDGTADTAPTRSTEPPGETIPPDTEPPDTEPPDTEPPDTEPPGPGTDLDAELVAFVGGGSPAVEVPPAVLASRDAVTAWIGWFEAQNPEQATALRRALEPWTAADDDAGSVLVAFAPRGCAEAGAELTVTGADLDVALTGGEGVDCAVAVGFAVVFSVDPIDLDLLEAASPDGITLAGAPPPTQVGPGTLALFEGANTTTPPSREAVVLEGAALESWIATLEAAELEDIGDRVADAAATAGPDEVAVGAVVQGCAEEGAELVLGPEDDVAVALVGPDDVNCDAPETYVAVLIAPAELLSA